MKLASLLQFAMPGTPCVYYGDEIGMSGSGDPDCRRCMVWDEAEQDLELFGFFKWLIALRKESIALQTGTLSFLYAKTGDPCLAFIRQAADERILFLTNASERSAELSLQTYSIAWQDMQRGFVITSKNGKLSVELPPYGFLVLKS